MNVLSSMKLVIGVFLGLGSGALFAEILGHAVDAMFSIPESIESYSWEPEHRKELKAWRASSPPMTLALLILANALGAMVGAAIA
ncbi:MAG: hypothetical protein AAF517_23450, partial [Planctomycetota bacterium]